MAIPSLIISDDSGLLFKKKLATILNKLGVIFLPKSQLCLAPNMGVSDNKVANEL